MRRARAAREPRSLAGLVLVKTPGSWWRVGMDEPIHHLSLSARAWNALLHSEFWRVADLRELDPEQLAGRRRVGSKTVEEIALLRDVVRYRSREPSPDRAAFDADLTTNRIPVSWRTVLEDDRLDTLKLSQRVRAALAAAGLVTARDLLDSTVVELEGQGNVGPAAASELHDLFKVLHHRFSDVPWPREESLDGYFEQIYPRPPARGGSDREQTIIRHFLGLGPGGRDNRVRWSTQTTIAADLGVSRGLVHRAVTRARHRWGHPARHHIRRDLRRILEVRGGVATVTEMVEDLLAVHGSAARPELRRPRAGAVIRAGVEAERPGASPLRAFRRCGEIYVAGRGKAR